MKRIRRQLRSVPKVWLVLCLLFAGCSQPKFDQAAQALVEQEASQMLHDYYDHICTEGLRSEFQFLDSTADFPWKPPGEARILHYDTIAAMIRRNILEVDSTCPTWESLQVTALAPDSARYQGRLRTWTRMQAGDTSLVRVQEKGLLIRRDGRWRLLSGETMVVDEL